MSMTVASQTVRTSHAVIPYNAQYDAIIDIIYNVYMSLYMPP
jgi:hypothetical protein